MGGQGVISVLSNVFPDEVAKICSYALGGQIEKAAKLQTSILPAIHLLFSEVNPIPVKFFMKTLGYDCGECRLPLTSPSKNLQNLILKYKK